MTYTTGNNNGQSLTVDDLSKTMLGFRTKHGPPLKAIRVSSETLHWIESNFPVYPSDNLANTLYGVPIQIDNDLELFDCKPVYA